MQTTLNPLSLVCVRRGSGLTFQKGWILSRPLDLSVFLGLSLVGLLLPVFVSEALAYKYFLYLILFDGLISFGHSFGTIYPFAFMVRHPASSVTFARCTGVVVACLIFNILLYNTYTQVSIAVLSLWLFWHYIQQKQGWLNLCLKKNGFAPTRADKMMIYNVCLVPFLVYLSNPLLPEKMFMLQGDVTIATLPGFLYQPLVVLFYAFSAWYLWDQTKLVIRTQTINLAKYVIILSGLLCFYLPYMVFAGDFIYWIAPSLPVHAISYTLFTYFFSVNHKMASSARKKSTGRYPLLYFPLQNLLAYVCAALSLGLVVTALFWYDRWTSSSFAHTTIMPFVFTLFFIHFISDATVWKSRFMKPR